MDEEFEKIERGLTATQWVTDYDPMKKQIAVALNRLEEQKRRAKAVGENKYKPILFVVAICIKDAERAVKVLEDDFDLKGKVVLVTEDSADTVVGRGLRRRSYVTNDNGKFTPEYAEVYGVPFSFIPCSGSTTEPKPGPIPTRVRALPERAHLEITFPRLTGYRYEMPEEKLKATFTDLLIMQQTASIGQLLNHQIKVRR